MRLVRTLLGFNGAAPGSIIPLRSLVGGGGVPGSLRFACERLRVPPSVGLPLLDVPVAPHAGTQLLDLDAGEWVAPHVAGDAPGEGPKTGSSSV
jgi:hypothetical protein